MEKDTLELHVGLDTLRLRDIELGLSHRTYSLRHLKIDYVLSILYPNDDVSRSIALLKGEGNNNRELEFISNFESFSDLHKYLDLLQQIDGLVNSNDN